MMDEEKLKTYRVRLEGVMTVEVMAYDEREARATAISEVELEDSVVVLSCEVV